MFIHLFWQINNNTDVTDLSIYFFKCEIKIFRRRFTHTLNPHLRKEGHMKSSRSYTGSRQCIGSVSLHKEHQMQLIRKAREANDMAREPETYRIILEGLLTASEGKRILNQTDVSRILNKSRGWVIKRIGIKNGGIAVEALAMKLAKEFC